MPNNVAKHRWADHWSYLLPLVIILPVGLLYLNGYFHFVTSYNLLLIYELLGRELPEKHVAISAEWIPKVLVHGKDYRETISITAELFRNGKDRSGTSVLQAALERRPRRINTDIECFKRLNCIKLFAFVETEAWSDAVQQGKALLNSGGPSGDVYYLMARALQGVGRFEEANNYFMKAMEVCGNCPLFREPAVLDSKAVIYKYTIPPNHPSPNFRDPEPSRALFGNGFVIWDPLPKSTRIRFEFPRSTFVKSVEIEAYFHWRHYIFPDVKISSGDNPDSLMLRATIAGERPGIEKRGRTYSAPLMSIVRYLDIELSPGAGAVSLTQVRFIQ